MSVFGKCYLIFAVWLFLFENNIPASSQLQQIWSPVHKCFISDINYQVFADFSDTSQTSTNIMQGNSEATVNC